MATLIAIDGDYLNRALRKKAQNLSSDDFENTGKPRIRIDFAKFADLLADPLDRFHEDLILNYYTSQRKVDADDEVTMGRVNKYWHDRGYGFIGGADGKSYFFHNKDVINKRDLRVRREDRYPHPTTPAFSKRIIRKVVSFKAIENEEKLKAIDVRVEKGGAVDRYYRLRREPFLQMLADTGYNIVRCHGSTYQKGKDKNVDCRIYFDAMRELQDGEDRLVLVSDDPVFTDLVSGLQEDEVITTVAVFEGKSSEALRKLTDSVLILDDYLSEIEFEYDSEEETILSP
jgi:uncharacterized LabA/DUF88 family protein